MGVQATQPEQARAASALEPFRCRTCQRKLLMMTHRPLKDGAQLQVQCPKCREMNFLFGVDS